MIKHFLLILLVPSSAFSASTYVGRVLVPREMSISNMNNSLDSFVLYHAICQRSGDINGAMGWTSRIRLLRLKIERLRTIEYVRTKASIDLMRAQRMPPREGKGY